MARESKPLEPMTLRKLRLWHWNKTKSFREVERRQYAIALSWEQKNPTFGQCTCARNKMRAAKRNANFHLGCVQALNDVVSGYAEQDEA